MSGRGFQRATHQHEVHFNEAVILNLLKIHLVRRAFRTATVANAQASRKEPGIARFDVLQQSDDATRFVLTEAYRTPDAPCGAQGDHALLRDMAGYGGRDDGRTAAEREIRQHRPAGICNIEPAL